MSPLLRREYPVHEQMVFLWEMDPIPHRGLCLFFPDRSPEGQGCEGVSATAEWLCSQTDVLMPACAPHHVPWANGLTYTSVHLKWGTTKRLLWTANDSECKASSVPTRTEQPIKVGHHDSPSISDHQLQVDLSWGSIQNRSGPANFLWPGWRQRSPLVGTGIPWRYCWFSFRPLQ